MASMPNKYQKYSADKTDMSSIYPKVKRSVRLTSPPPGGRFRTGEQRSGHDLGEAKRCPGSVRRHGSRGPGERGDLLH